MIEASCLCGAVRLMADHPPTVLRQCNCSLCRRYGAIWAYYATSDARVVSGADDLVAWQRDEEATLKALHCRHCGCLTHYETLPGRSEPAKIAINARMIERTDAIAHLPIEMFDGAGSWTVLWTRPQPDLFQSPRSAEGNPST